MTFFCQDSNCDTCKKCIKCNQCNCNQITVYHSDYNDNAKLNELKRKKLMQNVKKNKNLINNNSQLI